MGRISKVEPAESMNDLEGEYKRTRRVRGGWGPSRWNEGGRAMEMYILMEEHGRFHGHGRSGTFYESAKSSLDTVGNSL